MRRASNISNVPRSRASTAGGGAPSVGMDSFVDDGFSTNSYGTERWQRSEGHRSDSHRHPSASNESLSSYQRQDEQSIAGSFVGNLSGRVSMSGSRRSNRFPSTSSRTDGAPAAPMEPGLRVMSVVVEKSNIAFCCYKEDENEIVAETCTATGYETEALVERFLQVARPNLVLVG